MPDDLNNARFALRRNKKSQKETTHEKDSVQGYPLFNVGENIAACSNDGDNVDCHIGVIRESNER